MKRDPAIELIFYAILFAAMSVAVHKETGGGAPRVLYTGLIGGSVCLLVGVIGLSGRIREGWAILAVAALLVLVVVEAFLRIAGRKEERVWEPIPMLMLGIMLLFSAGMLFILGPRERSADDSRKRKGGE